jgi:hypothetical protein
VAERFMRGVGEEFDRGNDHVRWRCRPHANALRAALVCAGVRVSRQLRASAMESEWRSSIVEGAMSGAHECNHERATTNSEALRARIQMSSLAKKIAFEHRFFLTLNFVKSIPSLAAILCVAASMSYR